MFFLSQWQWSWDPYSSFVSETTMTASNVSMNFIPIVMNPITRWQQIHWKTKRISNYTATYTNCSEPLIASFLHFYHGLGYHEWLEIKAIYPIFTIYTICKRELSKAIFGDNAKSTTCTQQSAILWWNPDDRMGDQWKMDGPITGEMPPWLIYEKISRKI